MFGLEFGVGEKPRRPNFYGVDIRQTENNTVHYICNSWEITKFVYPNTVDEIFSRHFFEHLTFEQGRKTLEAWYSILKPGGQMEMILPDMEYHIKQWLDPNRKTTLVKRKGASDSTNEQEALKGFWGGQRGQWGELWDVHKSGYDFSLLQDVLLGHNFNDIERLNDAPKNLYVRCVK